MKELTDNQCISKLTKEYEKDADSTDAFFTDRVTDCEYSFIYERGSEIIELTIDRYSKQITRRKGC